MRRILVALSIVSMTGTGACFSVGAVNGAGSTCGTHAGCELTLQANTLAGMCTEMVLHNTGTYPMQGWSVEFVLPNGGHISNAWDANFIGDTNQVIVEPVADNTVLQPGASITVGFCSTVQAVDVNLTAGLCSTGDATNPNMSGSAVSDMFEPSTSPAFSTNLQNLDGWIANSTGGAGLACSFSGDHVAAMTDGLAITSSNAECGAVSRVAASSYGSFSSEFKASGTAGVITALAAAAGADEQINVQINGGNPWVANLSLTHKGVTTTQIMDLNFDTSAGYHMYAFTWTASGVTFVADGNNLASFSDNIPTGKLRMVLSTTTSTAHTEAGTSSFKSATYAP